MLYQNVVVGLIPERMINNGEPSLHAKCIAAAAPRPGDIVIHVGCGTGYYTAILAQLVGREGSIHAYELEPELASRAAENLAGYGTATVHTKSALEGQLIRADVIYVSAGATHVPAPWLDALTLGGRLVLPLTPNERLGCMLLVTRQSDDQYGARIFSTAAFIPCVGARNEKESRAVATALDRRSPGDVRSLRRDAKPDDTAWCVGEGWWLSTSEP